MKAWFIFLSCSISFFLSEPPYYNHSPNMSKSGHLLVLLSVTLLSLFSSQAARSQCRVPLFRRVGKVSSHVYLCECRSSVSKPYLAIGRSEVPALNPKRDTVGQNSAFYRCVDDAQAKLESTCVHSPSDFELEALQVLRKCINHPMNPTEKAQAGSFTYPVDKCQDRVGIVLEVPVTVDACTCKIAHNRYVVLARAGFRILSSPSNPTKEAKVIRKCIATTKDQLTAVCRNTPNDFQILSLQLLEACCKRFRSKFHVEKMDCKAILPDDLSLLK